MRLFNLGERVKEAADVTPVGRVIAVADCVAFRNFRKNTFPPSKGGVQAFCLSSSAVAVVPHIQSIPRLLSSVWVTDAPTDGRRTPTHTHTPRDL